MQVQDHIMLYGYKCKNLLGNKAFLHIFLSIMNKSYNYESRKNILHLQYIKFFPFFAPLTTIKVFRILEII